jgi:hypothetical protein
MLLNNHSILEGDAAHWSMRHMGRLVLLATRRTSSLYSADRAAKESMNSALVMNGTFGSKAASMRLARINGMELFPMCLGYWCARMA